MAFVTKWYMADPHFGHAAALGWGLPTRAFDGAADMDKAIVDRVNERVGKDDLLFILGDFAVSADPDYVSACFHALNGKKVLMTGNHDLDNKGRLKASLAALPWHLPPTTAMETKDGGQRVYLAHYAHRTWPASHFGSWHFYGHSHGGLRSYGRSLDVGIDCPYMGFGPRRFSELVAGYPYAAPADQAPTPLVYGKGEAIG